MSTEDSFTPIDQGVFFLGSFARGLSFRKKNPAGKTCCLRGTKLPGAEENSVSFFFFFAGELLRDFRELLGDFCLDDILMISAPRNLPGVTPGVFFRSQGVFIRDFFPYTVFRARRITFFLVNRVENQNEPKRPQKWWPFGFVLVFNSAYGNGRH